MFVIKKRSLVIVCALVITAITFSVVLGALAKGSVSASENDVVIVLDAGHGGVDAGVSGVSTGVKESELNLKVVKKIERNLCASGFNVVLTRSTSAGLYGVATGNLKRKEMLKRKEIIHSANPTLVVSVHMNYYSLPSRRGAQVFYKKGDEKAKALAESVQEKFNLMERATRTCNALTGDYYLLNCSEFPSIIAECGFLSNQEEETLLISDDYQEEIAYAIYQGIVGYLSEIS